MIPARNPEDLVEGSLWFSMGDNGTRLFSQSWTILLERGPNDSQEHPTWNVFVGPRCVRTSVYETNILEYFVRIA